MKKNRGWSTNQVGLYVHVSSPECRTNQFNGRQ